MKPDKATPAGPVDPKKLRSAKEKLVKESGLKIGEVYWGVSIYGGGGYAEVFRGKITGFDTTTDHWNVPVAFVENLSKQSESAFYNVAIKKFQPSHHMVSLWKTRRGALSALKKCLAAREIRMKEDLKRERDNARSCRQSYLRSIKKLEQA